MRADERSAEAVAPRRTDDPAGAEASLGIGEVVAALAGAFPGVSASKIRFLEDRGLVRPARTASGYRRFTPEHLDRIRLVLTLQRDRFLPLTVIREHLEALDRGERPDALPGSPDAAGADEAARLGEELAAPARRWTRAELAAESGAGEELIAELDQYSLLPSHADADGGYGASALAVARAARILAGHGLEPRHLRPFRAAADRELGIVERAVASQGTRRDAGTRARAAQTAHEIAQACLQLHTALVGSGLEQWDD